MRSLIPLMVARLSKPLATTVFAADAQGAGEGDLGGFGVVGATMSEEDVMQLYRSGRQARRTVVSLDGDVSRVRHVDRELRRCFPVTSLPERTVSEAAWRPLDWGRWKFREHITLGEARGVNKLLQIACLSCDGS